MWLKNLRLENWMLFREADLEFDSSSKVVGIVGRYLDGGDLDEERSNRSGKSSLVEAIRFLLYGVGRDRSQIKLINRSALQDGEGMKVHGRLVMANGREIGIARGRTKKGDPWVEVQGHEGAGWRETNAYLESILGFSHEEFSNTCYFGQGDIHQFMASDPKAKRDLILGWLNQERWVARETYCNRFLHDLSIQIESTKKSLAGIVDAGDVDELGKEVDKAEMSYMRASDQAKKKLNEVEALSKKLSEARKHVSLFERKTVLVDEIKEAKKTLKEATRQSKVYEQAANKRRSLLSTSLQIEEALKEKLLPLSQEKGAIEAQGKILGARLKDVQGARGVCPILGQKCDRVDVKLSKDIEKELSQLRKDYKSKARLERKLKAESDLELSSICRLLSEQEDVMEGNRAYPSSHEKRLKALESELGEIKSKLPKKFGKIEDIEQRHGEADRLYREAMELREGRGREVVEVTARFKRACEIRDQKKKWEEDLEALEKQRSAWRYAKFMFGGRGIPGEHLRVAFSSMEEDINFILGRLGVGMEVVFRPYRVTKTRELSCVACGWVFPKGHGKKRCSQCGADRQYKQKNALVLEINDTLEGQQSDFDMDSGGGQTLISFAVRLALLLLKIREGHEDPPPIILDEVVGNLDAYHRAAILDLVLNVLPSDYGFEQIWWISHNEEVQEALESKLLVCRSGDRSAVEWG